MHRKIKSYLLYFLLLSMLWLSCEKRIDIDLSSAQPQLIVEAYINNEDPTMNYVFLSRSVDYFNPNLNALGVTNAQVSITEGNFINNNYQWDTATKVELRELPAIPNITPLYNGGIYADPRLEVDAPNALIGTPGKSYLLEIFSGGKQYTAITDLPLQVQLDSLSKGFEYFDEEDSVTKFRMTSHFQDPDTAGNRYLFFWKSNSRRQQFGWGGMTISAAPGNDALFNGEYINFSHPQGFEAGDTLTYLLTHVSRPTYQFWDSYRDARFNNGPFATPVRLASTIRGENVIGCFSGFSTSRFTIIF